MADNSTTRSPRLLFLLNNDYGELALAMYFLQGRDLVDSSTLLLPPRLFADNKDTLPCEAREYKSIEDIIRLVDTNKPDIVFLFSGYILPNHELLSLEVMAALVQLLSDRDCKIVTSDPFFGIFSQMGPSTICGPEALRLFETDIIPDLSWEYRINSTCGNLRILEQFAIASHILKDTIHLYYCCPDPRDEPIEGSAHTAYFFNPCLVYDEKESSTSDVSQSGNADSEPAEKPHWLFILGAVDYELQTRLYGEAECIDMLEKKLNQTLQTGRRFVFLAPNECVQKLIGRVPISARKDLLNFCSFEDFTSLLLKAEYVFYWNLASYSTFLRVINGLPMFMFDGGHLVRHVKPMSERMAHSYYQNWTPPFLDPDEVLNTETLAELSKDYKQATRNILKNLKELPSPEQVIKDLLHK